MNKTAEYSISEINHLLTEIADYKIGKKNDAIQDIYRMVKKTHKQFIIDANIAWEKEQRRQAQRTRRYTPLR